MNRHRNLAWSLIFIVAIILSLSGSSYGKGDVSTNEIKVGAHTSLTGAFSIYGLPMKQCIQMAADQINIKGGININDRKYTLNLIWEDNKSSGEGGVAAVQKLISLDKVQFILGTITDCSVASAPLAEANKMVYISAAGGPDFISPRNKHCFTYGITTSMWYFPYLCRFPVLFPDAKKIAYLSMDTGYGRDGGKWVRAGISVSKLNLVSEEYFPSNTTEFGPVVTRVIAKRPSAIFINSGRGAAPHIVKTIREQGFQGIIAASSQFQPKTLLKILTKKDIEGLIDGLDPQKGKIPYTSPDLQDAIKAYEASHSKEPKIMPALAFMGLQVQILAGAIEMAQSLETSKIISALETGKTFNTWYGPAGFAKGGLYPTTHAAFWRFPISEIRDGELVGIDIVSAEQLIKYMNLIKK